MVKQGKKLAVCEKYCGVKKSNPWGDDEGSKNKHQSIASLI